jgi:hypothetical protein
MLTCSGAAAHVPRTRRAVAGEHPLKIEFSLLVALSSLLYLVRARAPRAAEPPARSEGCGSRGAALGCVEARAQPALRLCRPAPRVQRPRVRLDATAKRLCRRALRG